MSDRLSTLHGVSAIMILDVTTENTYANAVFPAGIIVRKSDNIFYLTDGTHTLAQLIPIVDQVLNTNEKTALANAFSSNNYVRAANGVVVHNSSGKIDDASLNLVSNGKLKVSYLSDFVENNLIKYAKLPDEVKQGFYVVNTYADLVTLDADHRKKLIVVKDASGDPVGNITGSGLYYYNNAWQSIIAVADTSLTAEDIQALGAVMYNHMIHVTTTNNNIRTVLNKLVIGEVIPVVPEEPEEITDTPHNEDLEYTEMGWEDFITRFDDVLNTQSADVYLTAEEDSSSDNIYFKITVGEGFELDLANTTVTAYCPRANDTTITTSVTSVVGNDSNIGICEYNWKTGEVAEGLNAIQDTDNSHGEHYGPVYITVTDGVHTYTAEYRRFTYHGSDAGASQYPHRSLPDLEIISGTTWNWQKVE